MSSYVTAASKSFIHAVNLYSAYSVIKTRKPCYRKDDRAMRPIYGCAENFRESLATPTATFPEIVKGLLLRSIAPLIYFF